MKDITHVIFDFDGTLADSQWYWTILNPLALQGRGYPVEEADLEFCRTAEAPNRWEYLKNKYSLTDEDRPTFDEIMVFLDRFYQTEVRLKPGVLEYLKILKERGMTLAVFSATRGESVRLGLAYLGIDKYFDYVFSTRDIDIGKGDPQSYRYCLREMGVAPESCIMVEDALYSIRTAKSLGMTVYAIRESCFLEDESEIRSLADRYAEKSMMEFLN